MGLKPWEFWALTFGEYDLLCEGYFTRQTRDWERTRFLAWAMLTPHTEPGKNLELTDIMKLPTDPAPITADPDYFKTTEQIDEILKTWKLK